MNKKSTLRFFRTQIMVNMVILCSLVFFSCDQEPLFWTVAKEVAPKKAKIKGAPTKIVAQGDKLYVGNGNLWEFSDNNWHEIAKPAGIVRDLAVANTTADTTTKYVLTIDNMANGDTVIWRQPSSSGTWEAMPNGFASSLGYQAIFYCEGILFVSKKRSVSKNDSTDFDIYIYENNVFNPTPIISSTGLLQGVVNIGTKYYIATLGDGIRVWDKSTATKLYSGSILGIIKTDATHNIIVAVSRDGWIYQINASNAPISGFPIKKDLLFTGALGLWENSPNKLLLLGISRNNNSNYGYREIPINADGTIKSDSFSEPGKAAPTSVRSYETYFTTLDKYPLNSLMQSPGPLNQDGLPVIFASMQTNGLWSFRYDTKESKSIWNAES
ncbi:MAG: hypothetical protein LBV68_08815 [Spirochaetaceae bacterium]|jgi:hypothetical protein|nr:hypothetical protein [Spirochaetaceae bacterium]